MSHSYKRFFTDIVVLLSTTVDVLVVFVGPLEQTAVVVTILMIHGFVTVPVKFVAGLGNKSPAPSVLVGSQNVVQTEPRSSSYSIDTQHMSDVSVLVRFVNGDEITTHGGTFH